jgi:hypothetical protein
MDAIRYFLFILLAMVLVGPAAAARLQLVPGRGGHAIVQLSGRIEPGDSDAFTKLLQKAYTANQVIDSVQLNSTGGIIGEGARIAAVIRTARLSTHVVEGALCASACFLVFAAGYERFAATGALIGVHKASEKGGRETSQSLAASQAMANFAMELGVPSAITAKMMATPSTRIDWLDPRDLKLMGVAVGSKPAPASRVAAVETPPEEVHGAPNSVATSEAAGGKEGPAPSTWAALIDKVMALSAEQNHGRPSIYRRCSPEDKECVMAVDYLLRDGRHGLAFMAQDRNGDITRRVVCVSNASNDVRGCRDWDTGTSFRDVKNTSGEWSQVQELTTGDRLRQ